MPRYIDDDWWLYEEDRGKGEKSEGEKGEGEKKWWNSWSGRSRDGSTSGWLTAKFGWGNNEGKNLGSSGEWARALRTVRRLGRIVYDKGIQFSWLRSDELGHREESDELGHREEEESTNARKNKIVTLDKNKIVTLDSTVMDEEGMSDNAKLDVVVGGAMAAAGALEYYGPHDGYNMMDSVPKHVTAPVLKSLNAAHPKLQDAASWLLAHDRVTASFPGYDGYFTAERDYAHRGEVRDKVLATANAVVGSDEVLAATLIAVWDTLRPEDALVDTAFPLHPRGGEVREVAARVAERMRDAGPIGREAILRATHESVADLATLQVTTCESARASGAMQAMQLPGSADTQKGRDIERAREAENLVSRNYETVTYNALGVPSGQPGLADGESAPTIHVIDAELRPGSYRATLAHVRSLVQKTRQSLAFRNEEARDDEYAMRRGRLDDGGIHRLIEGDPRIFRRTEFKGAPKVHVGLLVDMSGSMGFSGARYSGHGLLTRSLLARHAATLIREATQGLRGVRVSIWGHSGDQRFGRYGCEIYRFMEGGVGNPDRMGSIDGYGNNYDGYAIAYAEWRMRELATDPDENRVLIVLADGFPCAFSYGGVPAMRHVHDVVANGRKRGTDIFCLGIGSGLDAKGLTDMFGSGGWQIATNEREVPSALGKLLKQALKLGRVTA